VIRATINVYGICYIELGKKHVLRHNAPKAWEKKRGTRVKQDNCKRNRNSHTYQIISNTYQIISNTYQIISNTYQIKHKTYTGTEDTEAQTIATISKPSIETKHRNQLSHTKTIKNKLDPDLRYGSPDFSIDPSS
jgi:hypothetical protein